MEKSRHWRARARRGSEARRREAVSSSPPADWSLPEPRQIESSAPMTKTMERYFGRLIFPLHRKGFLLSLKSTDVNTSRLQRAEMAISPNRALQQNHRYPHPGRVSIGFMRFRKSERTAAFSR